MSLVGRVLRILKGLPFENYTLILCYIRIVPWRIFREQLSTFWHDTTFKILMTLPTKDTLL
jgi:hypothetical protein